MKIRKRQMMAAVLAAVVTAGNAPLSYGAPAAVETDETMYVNLDVYGKAQKVNVVKSCSLNGVTDITTITLYYMKARFYRLWKLSGGGKYVNSG